MRPVTRLVTLDDASALTRLVCQNRDFLSPWLSQRDDNWYTLAGQRTDITIGRERYEQGTGLPHVILDESRAVVGRITLSSITRGAFQSCIVGYWVSAHANGRGLATAAAADIVSVAFGELRLHRVQAEVLPQNVASQRVLRRNGFVQFGLAPKYLYIAGRWQDHLMFQLLNPGFDFDSSDSPSQPAVTR